MSESKALEFTGERVIPGLVGDDLLNEHRARYRFAARFLSALPGNAAVLDAGCGAGGTREFEGAGSITAADISGEAVQQARANFASPGVRFVQAACESLPFANGSFDLIAAFEVIEHLERWPDLLNEAARTLKPHGVFLVSTPNKAYYEESRAAAGPNPFHCHEFEYEEFRTALYTVFPHVAIWTQNHSEALVFAPPDPKTAALDASGDAEPAKANFFVAACSRSGLPPGAVYAWIPSSANLLRERERHILKLEGELHDKDAWLRNALSELSGLQKAHEGTLVELESRNQWAEELNQQLRGSATTIASLQEEIESRLAWVRQLETQISSGRTEIERLNQHRAELEQDLAERARWGFGLQSELDIRSAQLSQTSEKLRRLIDERKLIAASKWIRLGRRLRLGPLVEDE